MVIRSARPLDVALIVAVAGVGGAIGGLPAQRQLDLVAEWIERGDCLVHEDADRVLDGVLLFESRTFFGYDFVKLLAVGLAARRQGIGGQLLEAALGWGTTSRVFISTNESNAPMRALLARQHWTFSGTLTGIDEGDPELVFWRPALPRTGG